MTKLKIYLKAIALPVICGLVVGLLTRGAMANFKLLTKPFLAPPAILFPIVWTILYILMGVSYGLLKANNANSLVTEKSYYAQLIVNLIWPIIFFVLEWRFIALLWIILLLVLVINMAYQFFRQEKIAGLLQIPYILWVMFATYLNLFFFLLNR